MFYQLDNIDLNSYFEKGRHDKKNHWKIAVLLSIGTFLIGATKYKVEKDVYVTYFIQDNSGLEPNAINGVSIGRELKMNMERLEKSEGGEYIYKSKLKNLSYPFLFTEKIEDQPQTLVLILYDDDNITKKTSAYSVNIKLVTDVWKYSFSKKDLTVLKGAKQKMVTISQLEKSTELDSEMQKILAVTGEFQMNKDHNKRNSIIGISSDENQLGGITRFEKLDINQLDQLIRLKFADPRDCQNNSPSIGDIYKLMKKWSSVKAFGYAVSHEREDYRVSLEGFFCEGAISQELRNDFILISKGADELETQRTLYAWWD